jgi:hypothetical protein
MTRSLEKRLGAASSVYVDFQGSRKTSSIWYAASRPTGVKRKATAFVPSRLVTLHSKS